MVCGWSDIATIYPDFCDGSIYYFYYAGLTIRQHIYGIIPTIVEEGTMNFQNIENVYYWGAIMSSILIFAVYFLFMKGDK